jgi:hypothetical protein
VTDRDLSAAVRASLNAETSEDVLLTFAEITHPLLAAPLRAVTDVLPYTWGGVAWQPVMFRFEAVQDDERDPEARIILPAIDRTIAQALISLPDRARVSIWVLTSADFDLTQEPRVAIGTPVPLRVFLDFDLVGVTGNATEASGQLVYRQYAQEPYPSLRATKSRCPGLFT